MFWKTLSAEQKPDSSYKCGISGHPDRDLRLGTECESERTVLFRPRRDETNARTKRRCDSQYRLYLWRGGCAQRRRIRDGKKRCHERSDQIFDTLRKKIRHSLLLCFSGVRNDAPRHGGYENRRFATKKIKKQNHRDKNDQAPHPNTGIPTGILNGLLKTSSY